MTDAFVTITDFRRLEEKVNLLLSIHEGDATLTFEEKQLLTEAKDDIQNKRKEKFIKIEDL